MIAARVFIALREILKKLFPNSSRLRKNSALRSPRTFATILLRILVQTFGAADDVPDNGVLAFEKALCILKRRNGTVKGVGPAE